jgi:aquaporin Z
MTRKLAAEALGTFWLVFAICCSAISAAAVPEVGIGWMGVSFAAGLAILTMAYAVGGISGGHFNPAVSLGLAMAGRFEYSGLVPYWIAQVIGGLLGAIAAWIILSGVTPHPLGNFASNGFGELSPGGYVMWSVFLAELLFTAIFLLIILGATSRAAPAGFAPIAIGLGLFVIHLASIPISNTSVNPARSIATALIAIVSSGDYRPISQIWLFILAPLLGGALGAIIWRYVLSPGESPGNVGQPT